MSVCNAACSPTGTDDRITVPLTNTNMIFNHVRHLSRHYRTLWMLAVLCALIPFAFGIKLLLGDPVLDLRPSADDQVVGLGFIVWSVATIVLTYRLSKGALWMMGILAGLVLLGELWSLFGLRLSTYGLARILVEQYFLPLAAVVLPFELYRRVLQRAA